MYIPDEVEGGTVKIGAEKAMMFLYGLTTVILKSFLLKIKTNLVVIIDTNQETRLPKNHGGNYSAMVRCRF